MSLDRLYPHAGNHAIQSVLFALEWPTELKGEQLNDIGGHVTSAVRTFLPVAQTNQMVRVNLDSNQAVSSVPEVGGFSWGQLSSSSANMFRRQLDLSRNHCSVTINDYSRWDKIWPEVQNYLHPILEKLPDSIVLSNVVLQYTDTFLWKGDSPLPTELIFKKDSKFLAKNVFELDELWHCHHGYFESVQAAPAHKRLDNININVVDTDGVRAVQIIMSHKAMINLQLTAMSNTRDLLDNLMIQMHEKNKEVLRELLTVDVCSKIDLA